MPAPSTPGMGRTANGLALPSGTLTRMTGKRVSGRRVQVMRQNWQVRIDDPTQTVVCPRCDEEVKSGQEWDLGHQEDLALGGHPLGPMVPEHRRGCNRSAGGSLGALLRPRSRTRLSEWMEPRP